MKVTTSLSVLRQNSAVLPLLLQCIPKLRWVFPSVMCRRTSNAGDIGFSLRHFLRVSLPLDTGISPTWVFALSWVPVSSRITLVTGLIRATYRSTSIAESQRGRSRRSRVCYSSFLAVMAELHSNDSVYVEVKPCSIVQWSPGATQFGVYRIRWTTRATNEPSVAYL